MKTPGHSLNMAIARSGLWATGCVLDCAGVQGCCVELQNGSVLGYEADHSKSRKYQLKLRNMFIHSVTQVARKNKTEYSQQEWV